MADCIFCKINSGEINTSFLYEDEQIMVFRDMNPRAPVHLLVVPREHIADLGAAEEKHKELLGHINLVIAEMAKQEGISEKGYRVIVNKGTDGGQEVFHLHYHLLGGAPFGNMVTYR